MDPDLLSSLNQIPHIHTHMADVPTEVDEKLPLESVWQQPTFRFNCNKTTITREVRFTTAQSCLMFSYA